MDTSSSTKTATLLQKGISASRAGRSDQARRLLRQVVATEPDNEGRVKRRVRRRGSGHSMAPVDRKSA